MIRLSRTILPVLAIVLSFCLIGGANAAEWTVSKSFGQSWVETNGVQKVSLGRGGRVLGNATVHTGADGRVVLVRGRESMTVGPNSSVSLNDPRQRGKTTIRHHSGSAVYQVEKRNAPHFTVRTQTIAALVKGTKFKVVENRYVSKVWVSEGLVQVTVFSTGETANIRAGQAAIFEKARNRRLIIVGPGAKEPITRAAIDPANGLLGGLGLGATASNLKGTVSGVTSSAAGTASGAASSVSGSVSGTVSDVTSSVGGGLGGLF